MKKLYRKGSVHPSPPVISDPLAFLPAAILTLSAALSPEDRQVLAYLISCSSSNFSTVNRSKSTAGGSSSSSSGDHSPSFGCNCFRCYTSYWVRWDSSPNRQLIHEIIEALENDLVQTQVGKGKKERRKRGSKGSERSSSSSSGMMILIQGKEESVKTELPEEEEVVKDGGLSEEISGEGSVVEAEEMEKGSVRKIVSFIGERFWNIWT